MKPHKINPNLIWGEEIGDEIRDAGETSDRYDAARVGSRNLLVAIALYFARTRRTKIERDYWRKVVVLCDKN